MKGIRKPRRQKLNPTQAITITAEQSANTIKFEVLLHTAFSTLDFIEMEAERKGYKTTSQVLAYRSLLEQFKTEMVDKGSQSKKEEIYQAEEMLEDFRKEHLVGVSDIEWFLLLNRANAIIFGRVKPIYRDWRRMNLIKLYKKNSRSKKATAIFVNSKMEAYETALKKMTSILHKLANTSSKQYLTILSFLDENIKVELR